MSTIPGQFMYHEARKAGVPLQSWNELLEVTRNALTPSDSAIAAFNRYASASEHGAADVEEMHRRHWRQYLSWRFKRRSTWAAGAPVTAARSSDQARLRKSQTDFMRRLMTLRTGGDPVNPAYSPKVAARLYRDMHRAAGLTLSNADKELLQVVEMIEPESLRPDIEAFFEHYVHDSVAGFMEFLEEFSLNGLGIGKFRTVFKGEH